MECKLQIGLDLLPNCDQRKESETQTSETCNNEEFVYAMGLPS